MRGHLSPDHHGAMDQAPTQYSIRVNGHLGAMLLSAFPAMTSQHQGTQTVLTGFLDRSALHGVLADIEALGLELVEIRQLAAERPAEPGPRRSS
jgi:hypothetical protein